MTFVWITWVSFLWGRVLSESHQVVRFEQASYLVVVSCRELGISFATLDLHDMILLTASHTLFLVEIIRTEIGLDRLLESQKFLERQSLRERLDSFLRLIEITYRKLHSCNIWQMGGSKVENGSMSSAINKKRSILILRFHWFYKLI